MKIIDFPQYTKHKTLVTLEQEAYLIAAIRKMQDFKVGSILVTHQGKLCGIFTERDLLMKIAGTDIDINKTKLMDVMTVKLHTSNVQDYVQESMKRMTEQKIRHLPVIDDKGQLVGIISQGDFIYLSWSQLLQQLKSKTKSTFFSLSQVWMLVIGLIGYVILIYITLA
jgi:signal-transduction protein with cAMP-binding, CBS, and nucleotidyltransferase domain